MHLRTDGVGRPPLVAGDAEGAGHHAVAAAQAHVAVVDHRPFRGLLQRAHRARRRRRPARGSGGTACGRSGCRASRTTVVQRSAERPSAVRSSAAGRRPRQVVDLLAGDDALLAADALGHVGEDAGLLDHTGSPSFPRAVAHLVAARRGTKCHPSSQTSCVEGKSDAVGELGERDQDQRSAPRSAGGRGTSR